MSVRMPGFARWTWPRDLRPYATDLAALLEASAVDDGILGYADPSAAQSRGFATGLVRAVDEGAGHVLLGSDEEGIIAMCVMTPNLMPNCRHIAEVSKAFLLPRVRGTRALLELTVQVCAKAREVGVELFTIDVREGAKAHRVWQHLGFRTYGVLEDYARVDGRTFRGHYMSITVDELEAYVAPRLAASKNPATS